jgi:hypothetical protein
MVLDLHRQERAIARIRVGARDRSDDVDGDRVAAAPRQRLDAVIRVTRAGRISSVMPASTTESLGAGNCLTSTTVSRTPAGPTNARLDRQEPAPARRPDERPDVLRGSTTGLRK